tara:strand:+ start:4491 stop:5000 length:510 start_codon:yes stop_codon:yes gene_type:complete
MSWKEILKEISRRERMDAEDFAAEDMNAAKIEKIKPRIEELYKIYTTHRQADFNKHIRVLDEAGRLFTSAGLPPTVHANYGREINIKGFEDFLNENTIKKNENDAGIVKKLGELAESKWFLEGLIDTDKLPKGYENVIHDFGALMIMLDPTNQEQGYEGSWKDYRKNAR